MPPAKPGAFSFNASAIVLVFLRTLFLIARPACSDEAAAYGEPGERHPDDETDGERY